MSCLKELKLLGWNGNDKNALYVYNLLKSLQDLARSFKFQVIGEIAVDLYNEHKSKHYHVDYNENTIIDLYLENENKNVIEYYLQQTFFKIQKISNYYKVDDMFTLKFHHNSKISPIKLIFWEVDIHSFDTKKTNNYISEDFNYTFFQC